MHGRNMGMTSLAEDFNALGASHLLSGGSKTGSRGNRKLNEDVQMSGHGTSYPSPGSEVRPGLRRPDDEGRTDPNRTSENRRRSRLREDDQDPENPFENDEPTFDPTKDTEDDDQPYGGDDPDAPQIDTEDDEDPEAAAAAAAAGDGDGDQDDQPMESKVIPPGIVKIGEVRIVRPKTRKLAVESRRYSTSAARYLIKVLSENRRVVQARGKRKNIVESKLRERGLRAKGSTLMNEVRDLIESMKAPTSRFEDFVDAFNALANLDESMVVKWAQLESKFVPPASWGNKFSFKKLAESALVRATDACLTLKEMGGLKTQRLNRAQVKYLEEQLDRLGREQMLAFESLCDTLVSVGLSEDINDLHGVNEDDQEPADIPLPHEGPNGSPAELGDIPSENRRRRVAGDADPPFTSRDNGGGMQFSYESRRRRGRTEATAIEFDPDAPPPAPPPDQDPDLGEMGMSYELDGQGPSDDEVSARFADMDRDELVRECGRMAKAMSEYKRKMGEDGRMPTDIVPEGRTPRPRNAPMPRGR